MNIFIIIGIVVLNFILQSTILQYIGISGVVPNTSLILVNIFGLLGGKNIGAIVGLITGLLQDIFFGGPIGINALTYSVIGYSIGLLDNKVFKENLLLPLSTTFVSTFAYHILYYLFMIFLSIDVSFTLMLKNILLKETIYNSLLSIILYKKILKYYRAPHISFTKKM